MVSAVRWLGSRVDAGRMEVFCGKGEASGGWPSALAAGLVAGVGGAAAELGPTAMVAA